MNLKEHYQTLYKNSIEKIKNDNYDIDELIHSPHDNRFGITLLIRPPQEVKHKIQTFLNELRAIAPNQYFYPNSDIHITVMSIVSCYDGFQLKQINISKYIEVIEKSIPGNPDIEIQFNGITASPSCIMIKGFMNNNSLNLIRNNLRENFKKTNLEQSLDKRYAIQTAHATVVRFSEKFNDKLAFLNSVNAHRSHNFGTFKVDKLELVYNDWYQRQETTKRLFEFKI